MLRYIVFFSTLIMLSSVSFAGEAADKVEFKRLYAEFNELYANSDDLDAIINVAESVYRYAPRVYSKTSKQYAATLYNLATLYHEKGENSQTFYDSYKYLQHSSIGKKAVDYYERYFIIIDKFEEPYDRNYLDQYFEFVKADTSFYGYKSDVARANRLISIAKDINLPGNEFANLNYTLGTLRIKAWQNKQAKPFFKTAYDWTIANENDDHILIGKSAYWLGLMAAGEEEFLLAEKYYLQALDILPSKNAVDKDTIINIHFGLAHLYVLENKLDKAAQHGQLYSEQQGEDNNRTVPVVKAEPVFSYFTRKKKSADFIELEFTLDIKGIPKDIVVIETSKNNLVNPCVEAIKKFRFIPEWVNGKRAELHGVKYKFVFNAT
ncbi:MAG: tetratricopeptide repeat protein [Emcibacteraceae bacterium]|nr:tetratricopeptide repeat protein [Emcibacteraceae bacterium]